MQAAEAKLQRVLEGSKQFLVPHYQRPYSWQAEQWEALWRDILVLIEEENPQPHFLGSIVTSPARSIPEGVEKRLLIDGQQRLTTLLILFALLRDQARVSGLDKLALQIEDLYLTNRPVPSRPPSWSSVERSGDTSRSQDTNGSAHSPVNIG